MIRVESDGPELGGAQVSVHGDYKELSFELAALAAQLLRHNWPAHLIMASISYGLAHVDDFEEDKS
jgi:hypothetical protein